MRILFANHTAAWSGGEVSLMRLVHTLGADHDVAVACPPRGPLAEAVDREGALRLRLPPVEASLRLHPVRTPVGLVQIGAGGAALALAARRFRAEVVHANTPRAGLMGAVARRLGGPPFIVRAHEHVPLTPVGRAVRGVILRSASAVVAVSDYTARRFDEGLPRPFATRVYNSIDHARFDPDRVQPAPLREELGIAPGAALLGQVAQITPWKGQDTAIRALAELRRAGIDAHLVLVGGIAFAGKAVRYDNPGYLRALERLAGELRLLDRVHFLGQRDDVPQILRALDLTLLPSWDEPFGLATVESMALGTPPLVSDVGAGPEIVEDGVSGRLLPPRRPELWAAAAAQLLRDRDGLQRLAEGGPPAAARFRDDVHAREMLLVYERAAARPPSPAAAVPGRRQRPRADDVVEAAPWPP
jgi:glycosyltransferase involved in cell wall biosynthesis